MLLTLAFIYVYGAFMGCSGYTVMSECTDIQWSFLMWNWSMTCILGQVTFSVVLHSLAVSPFVSLLLSFSHPGVTSIHQRLETSIQQQQPAFTHQQPTVTMHASCGIIEIHLRLSLRHHPRRLKRAILRQQAPTIPDGMEEKFTCPEDPVNMRFIFLSDGKK
jgi:hypothetical protein